MLDLRLIESFCSVVEHGALQRAARELGFAQSTLTQRIQQLEESLGTELFSRQNKRLCPTELGRAFYDEAAALVRHAHEVEAALSRLKSGEAPVVRFAAVESAMLSPVALVLSEFCRRFPNARVRAESATTGELAKKVYENAVDFAIGGFVTLEGKLTFTRLYDTVMGVLLPKTHPLAAKARIEFSDLPRETLIFSEESCSFRQVFETDSGSRGVTLRPAVEIASIQARMRAVQQGVGIALIPKDAVAAGAPPGTAYRDVTGARARVPIGILRRSDALPPAPATQAFIDLLRRRFSQGRRRPA